MKRNGPLPVLSSTLYLLISRTFQGRGQIPFEFDSLCQYPKNFIAILASRCGRCAVSGVASQLFSTREREVLELLGQGKTSKEIAVLLTLSIPTIASHRRSICRKLGVHSTAELIHYAVARHASRSGIEMPPH